MLPCAHPYYKADFVKVEQKFYFNIFAEMAVNDFFFLARVFDSISLSISTWDAILRFEINQILLYCLIIN